MTIASDLRRTAYRARTATERRDELIRARRVEGAALRQIADEAGLSHTAIANILDRE